MPQPAGVLSRIVHSPVGVSLLVLLVALLVRLAHLYETGNDPLASVAGASHLADAVAARASDLPPSPVFSWLRTQLAEAGGEIRSLQWAHVVLGVATCLLVAGIGRQLFSPAIGFLSGIGAALCGPLVYFGAEPTAAVWSAFLLTLLGYLLVRTPAGGAARVLTAGALALIAAAEFAGLPTRFPDSADQYLANLYYLLQGRELLPDLDPYRDGSAILVPLLWDRVLAFPAGVVVPLAAVAVFVELRGRRREGAGGGLLVAAASILLAGAAVGADARHRLPLLLLLLPFAASALARGWWSGRLPAGLFLCLLLAANAATPPPSHLAGRLHHDYWMGVSLERQELPAHAIDAYDRLLVADPKHGLALMARARLALRDGQPDRALRLYEAYLEAHPATSDLFYKMGRAYVAMDRLQAAAAVFERALAAGDSSAGLLGWLGRARAGSGQNDEAARAYAAAIRVRPDSLELRYQLARVYEVGGRAEAAIKQYRQLLATGAEGHEIHARLGHLLIAGQAPDGESIYLERNELTDEAESHLRRAIELEEADLPANLHLAFLLSRQRRYREAIAQFERVLELAPEAHEVHLYLGNLHQRAGDEEAAQRHFAIYRRVERGVEMQGVVRAQVRDLLGTGSLSPGTR